MEGVEFTSSQPSGSNNAFSSNQTVVQQLENNNGQGLYVLFCTRTSPKKNEQTASPTLDKSDKQPQQNVPGLKTYVVTTIKGIKVIKVTYESEELAQKVAGRQIIEEKNIFEKYLHSIGNVKGIKSNIKQMYYEVAVTFADRKLEQRFEKE
ncbi:hypothetical protein RhiirC2_794745 [Rhizophagus irregularis]|uniref:Uncharacterized protein n=1 Tax=Rhizophagus irregularis TaxID=588596 RepID=A0A2N1MCZ8_9GLOM|nr:hypothetical protein RhiirC2_794745 [Rhizophagus irregularis]